MGIICIEHLKSQNGAKSTVDNHNQISIRLQPSHSIVNQQTLTVLLDLRQALYRCVSFGFCETFFFLNASFNNKMESAMTLGCNVNICMLIIE